MYMYSSNSSRCLGSMSLRNITVLLPEMPPELPSRLKRDRKKGEQMLRTSLWAEKNLWPAARVQSVYSSLWHNSYDDIPTSGGVNFFV